MLVILMWYLVHTFMAGIIFFVKIDWEYNRKPITLQIISYNTDYYEAIPRHLDLNTDYLAYGFCWPEAGPLGWCVQI